MKFLIALFFLLPLFAFGKIQQQISYASKLYATAKAKDRSDSYLLNSHNLSLGLNKSYSNFELNAQMDFLKFFKSGEKKYYDAVEELLSGDKKLGYADGYDIRFRQLYLRYQHQANSLLTVGRFDLDLGDETILSSNRQHHDFVMDWNYYYEGLHYEYNRDNWSLSALLGLHRGVHVAGGVFTFRHPAIEDLSVYLLRTGDCSFNNKPGDALVPFKKMFKSDCDYSLNRYGFSASTDIKDLSLRASLSGHGKEFMTEGELNYNYKNHTISFLYHRDSKNYRPLSYDVHYNAGIADLFYWGNLTYYGTSLSSQFTRNLTLNFAYLYFQKTDTSAYVYWAHNPFQRLVGENYSQIAVAPLAKSDNKSLTHEFDFIIIYEFKKLALDLSAEMSYIVFDSDLSFTDPLGRVDINGTDISIKKIYQKDMLKATLSLNYEF